MLPIRVSRVLAHVHGTARSVYTELRKQDGETLAERARGGRSVRIEPCVAQSLPEREGQPAPQMNGGLLVGAAREDGARDHALAAERGAAAASGAHCFPIEMLREAV